MWLIGMTTPEQKIGLADYFSPAGVSLSTSGAGGILYGTVLDTSGNRPSTPRDAERGSAEWEDNARPTGPGLASDVEASRPVASVEANWSAIVSLRQALQSMPDIAELSRTS